MFRNFAKILCWSACHQRRTFVPFMRAPRPKRQIRVPFPPFIAGGAAFERSEDIRNKRIRPNDAYKVHCLPQGPLPRRRDGGSQTREKLLNISNRKVLSNFGCSFPRVQGREERIPEDTTGEVTLFSFCDSWPTEMSSEWKVKRARLSGSHFLAFDSFKTTNMRGLASNYVERSSREFPLAPIKTLSH